MVSPERRILNVARRELSTIHVNRLSQLSHISATAQSVMLTLDLTLPCMDVLSVS